MKLVVDIQNPTEKTKMESIIVEEKKEDGAVIPPTEPNKVDIEPIKVVKVEEDKEFIKGEKMVETEKGIVTESTPNRYEKIAQQLHEAVTTVGAIPIVWVPEINRLPLALAANLGDLVKVYPQIQGAAGDTVRILTITTPAFSSSVTTSTHTMGYIPVTLTEYGATTVVSYAQMEQLTGDIVATIEAGYLDAAKIMEDVTIMTAMLAGSGSCAGVIASGTVSGAAGSICSTDTFVAKSILEGLRLIAEAGYSVNPGDLTLVLAPKQLQDLLLDTTVVKMLSATEGPGTEIQATGRLTRWCGVNILVTGTPLTTTGTGNATVYRAFLFRNDAVALVPKRNLLIETQKVTTDRNITITGTHVFGVGIPFPKAMVVISSA